MKAWCNGRIVATDEPALSVIDHGVTVGDGVFETLKMVEGVPFALTRHLDRLSRSAAGLGLPDPDHALIRRGITEILTAAPGLGPLGVLRVTYTSGPGPLGSDRGPGPQTLAITVTRGKAWPETTSIAVSPWPRNERSPLVGLKSTSYAENAIALAWAKARGYSEAVMGNLAGNLCEGTGSNIFIVMDDEILTPPLTSGCLAGVTRDLVIEWCGANEQEMSLDVLEHADEIFLTSSTRDVHPVDRIAGRTLEIGHETIGAREIFRQRSSDIDP